MFGIANSRHMLANSIPVESRLRSGLSPNLVQPRRSQEREELAVHGAKLLDVTEKCDKQWLNEGQKVFEVVEA